jgi:hypothetical protein
VPRNSTRKALLTSTDKEDKEGRVVAKVLCVLYDDPLDGYPRSTSLSAQARYAAGTREILECFFDGTPIRDEYLIVDGGKVAGTGAHSYTS